MGSSADIRKENKRAIYQLMLDGGQYTKNQVSRETGLSVATCNTLLNDMKAQGLVEGGDKTFGEVGRSSVLYQISEDHERYLAIHFVVEQSKKMAETLVFSPTGKILFQEKKEYETIDYRQVETIVENVFDKVTNLKQIIVGVPGIAEHGISSHCDIPELNGVELKACLEKRFGVNVTIKNDMTLKAMGYYKLAGNENDVITLGYFPSHILPGTATIHKGMVISGANHFAGMTGFLPYGISREEEIAMLEKESCVPFIKMSIWAVIVLLNPSTIVLTGDLIDEETVNKVKEECSKDIPAEFMPEFKIAENFDSYYYEGMYQQAVYNKEF